MQLPVNILLLDVDKYILKNETKEVKSVFIKEPSSHQFHHDGLFSEEIFGQIGSTERLTKFGFIHLRTRVFHPIMYRNIIKLKGLYEDIIARKAYAIFDEGLKDFVKASDSDEEAGTGMRFFMSRFEDIKFTTTNSLTRKDKIEVINKFKKQTFISNMLVMPAGIRDMSVEDGKPESGSINKLYMALINYVAALPFQGTESEIYDNIRYSIQKKINEIYEFIFDMIEGKYGFFQRKYGSRNLALGTRNVASISPISGTNPNDSQFFKEDETKVPLYQAAKAFQPLVVYNLKMLFSNGLFSQSSDQVAVIDPSNYHLVYQSISEDEKNKFLSSDGLSKMIDLYFDREFRFKPVTILNEKGQRFYHTLVYDDGDKIYYTRSLNQFKTMFKEPIKESKFRPITYAEMLYVATWSACYNKHVTVTRYPAIELGSLVPTKVHLISTNPGRIVKLVSHVTDSSFELPEYPIIGSSFIDTTAVHVSLLAGLGLK